MATLRDVLDLHGVEAGVGEQLRRARGRGRTPRYRRRPPQPQASPQPPQPSPQRAALGARGRSGVLTFCHCSWGRCAGWCCRGRAGSLRCRWCGRPSVRSRIQPYDEVAAPGASSRSGWSSRQWQPRVSSRSRAAATRTRATHRRLVASQVSTPGSAVLPFSSRASTARRCAAAPARAAAVARDCGGAQHARARGHDALDLEAGLGGEQRVRGPLGRGTGAGTRAWRPLPRAGRR